MADKKVTGAGEGDIAIVKALFSDFTWLPGSVPIYYLDHLLSSFRDSKRWRFETTMDREGVKDHVMRLGDEDVVEISWSEGPTGAEIRITPLTKDPEKLHWAQMYWTLAIRPLYKAIEKVNSLPESLPKKQRRVALLLLLGKSDWEIAEDKELNMTLRSVATISSKLAKMPGFSCLARRKKKKPH